uniref:TNFR-Cys domain-containing protein n=1 Tax=Oryzias sinensis TaxID=183150 RepID=A0A8C7X467_9TELE
MPLVLIFRLSCGRLLGGIESFSGTKLACDKCPAGTYVSTHCSPSSVRECTPCPEGTFTRGENGVQQCHRCRAPCPVGFTEKEPCTTTQDRVCACPPNSFSPRGAVGGCKPHSLCPPGTRVKKRGTQTEDVLCRPCTKGTFSSVESRATKCRNHTDCRALGLVLLSTGTRETDNVCGPPSTTPSLFPPSSSFGPEHAAIKQEPISSTLTSILYGPAHKGETTIRQISSLYSSLTLSRLNQSLCSWFMTSALSFWKVLNKERSSGTCSVCLQHEFRKALC